MRKIDTIIIHCSATKPSQNVPIETIKKWHVEERGWSDIGYHYYITRDGVLHQGRPIERPGAHAKGHNKTSIGICYEGGLDEDGNPEDNRTKEQIYTIVSLIKGLKSDYEAEKIIGHRDLPRVSKACPSFDVATFIKDFNL
jgi:N-acetyl-anhydromuramyl-L-alanine amidase AmpD